jgi:hypothetical protein
MDTVIPHKTFKDKMSITFKVYETSITGAHHASK